MTSTAYDDIVRDSLARAAAQHGPRTRIDGIDVAFTPAAPLDEDGAPLITCEPYRVGDLWRWMWVLSYGAATGRRGDTQPLAEWVDGDVPVDELVQQARRHLDALVDEDTADDNIEDGAEQQQDGGGIDASDDAPNIVRDDDAGLRRVRRSGRGRQRGEGAPTRLLVPLISGEAHVDLWRGKSTSLIVLDGVELTADEAAALARALAVVAEAAAADTTVEPEPETAEVGLVVHEIDLGGDQRYTVGVHHPDGSHGRAAVWIRPAGDTVSRAPEEARADAVELLSRAEAVADHEMVPTGAGGPAMNGQAAREIAAALFTAADIAELANLGARASR